MNQRLKSASQDDSATQAWTIDSALPVLHMAIDDVQHGDVLFFRKPGPVQRYTDAVGDTWRHIAIAARLQDHMWVLEAGLAGYRGRPLSTALAAYDTCGVLRLAYCERYCGARLAEDAQRLMSAPTAYPKKRELVLSAALSASRMTPSRASGWPGQLARRFAQDYVEENPGFEDRSICSRFVRRAFRSVCPEHQLVIDLTEAKPSIDTVVGKCDSNLDEYFTMPDDIWRSVDKVERYWLKA